MLFATFNFRTFLLLFSFIAFSFTNSLNAQVVKPGINFQAVAKDKEHNAASNRKIYIDCTIENGQANPIIVYGEHQDVRTNDVGIFNLVIGNGIRYIGANDIYNINWSSGSYYFHLKISITPIAPDPNWDYTKDWIDLGAVAFGVVPYAIQSLNVSNGNLDTAIINSKLNIKDTASMLLPYRNQVAAKSFDTLYLTNKINSKLSLIDTATMLLPYHNTITLSDSTKFVTPFQLTLNKFDSTSLSNRIILKEDQINKSVDLSLLSDYNDTKYPSVKATKNYVDAALISGAPDATTSNKGIIILAGDLTGSATSPTIGTNAISTIKLQDASVTDAKIASGISASKVGLGNVTNNAQLYNLNGLTAQVQNFGTPGTTGLAPNWQSSGASHTINIPMASASAVTGGLISKDEYDHFNSAYSNTINSITNNGNSGVASMSGNILNIPNYSIVGLAGNVNANTVFAGPSFGAIGAANFRNLVSADIPNNAANTLGNAATASKLLTPVSINNVLFDGTTNINITTNTSNLLTFTSTGVGVVPGSSFNGSAAKEISFNTIGAAPATGSTSITTLGNINTGTWAANVIGANFGGAGSNNGILKANGSGVVSEANAGTDFQTPLAFTSPLINTTNTISIPLASGVVDGYLSSIDWTNFNNKIDLTQKAANNGVASLDANGKIPTSQIPSISFSSGYVVTSQAAMLALSSAAVGSIAIRTDNNKNYVLSGLPATTLSNWLELLMPVSIASINGHTESSITLNSTDIAEGTNLYFTNTRARNAISATSPLVYSASTGVISMPTATASSAGYLTASDWSSFNNKLGAFSAQAANSFYAGPTTGVNALPTFRSIVVGDIPILNQNTTGNAGTATKLAATKNINGVAFDGSADITIASTIANAITFNSSGTGGTSPSSFDGSLAKTISYNTIGASPLIGSSSLITVGSITSGTWLGTIIDATHGGAGNVNGILKANGSGVVSAATAGTDFENPLTFLSPLSRTTNAISLSAATTTSNGYLTSTDWNLFNGKQANIVAGTGVSITGGNTVAIGQSVATSSSPSFNGLTLSGLNIAGIVTNTAAGILSTTATTGSGNIVRATSPTLVTPILGDASATSLNVGAIVSTSDITAKRFKLTMPASTTAAATTTLDLSTGNVFTINMGLSITTFTLTNPVIGTYLIKFVQDATGTRDVTFPVAWKWAGGVRPSLTNTANKIDVVTLIYDGTTYYATIVQNF